MQRGQARDSVAMKAAMFYQYPSLIDTPKLASVISHNDASTKSVAHWYQLHWLKI
jgi:hypothetical protein